MSTSYVEQRLNIVAEALPTGLKSGETYTFEMFANVNGANILSEKRSFTIVDNQKPVLTDVKVTDLDSEGYTITCTATVSYTHLDVYKRQG